ncbi:MAG TPA: hypothetical protein VJZ02_00365 [Candidatus Brocadiales bacterium]|nr:hypothetical protein [Candidatus Brocadiales bacterium]
MSGKGLGGPFPPYGLLRLRRKHQRKIRTTNIIESASGEHEEGEN